MSDVKDLGIAKSRQGTWPRQQWWPLEYLLLAPDPGWQLGLERHECSVLAGAFERSLNLQLQSGAQLCVGDVSESAMGLASALALKEALFARQASEGGSSSNDH